MKWLVIAAALAASMSPSYACDADLLSVESWDAVENEGNKFFPVDLSATVSYEGGRGFRMIHAGVIFEDALGRSVGQVNLDEDQQAASGDEIVVDGLVTADQRLLTINRNDVVARTCVWSIVYDDGTIEKF